MATDRTAIRSLAFPRPREVRDGITAELAAEDRLQCRPSLTCGVRVEVEDPAPRRPWFVVAVADRERDGQAGEVDIAGGAVGDQP